VVWYLQAASAPTLDDLVPALVAETWSAGVVGETQARRRSDNSVSEPVLTGWCLNRPILVLTQ
jgi:hypothetical protein